MLRSFSIIVHPCPSYPFDLYIYILYIYYTYILYIYIYKHYIIEHKQATFKALVWHICIHSQVCWALGGVVNKKTFHPDALGNHIKVIKINETR